MSGGGLYRIDHLFEICRHHHQSGRDRVRQFSPAWKASRNAREALWNAPPSPRNSPGTGSAFLQRACDAVRGDHPTMSRCRTQSGEDVSAQGCEETNAYRPSSILIVLNVGLGVFSVVLGA